ncbi:MAG: hypothetical protein LBQ28_05925 [Prevotellaceae bacterium]|jgi:hypothetical protein|nr:hypothetical protein [Prevotellaceae bacterium]
MKKSDYTADMDAENNKNKSPQIGNIITIAKDDFFTDKHKSHFTAAIIGIVKNINEKTLLNIRKEFHKLYTNNKTTQILDLGNVIFNKEEIKKLIADINKKNLNTVFLCEDDEISTEVLEIQQNKDSSTVLILPDITSGNKYISKIFAKSKNEISVIGYQNYFSDTALIDKLNKNHCTTIRLSEYRTDCNNIEPVLRDSNFIAIDLAAVRHSDGGANLSPNGLYAEELCAIANYAGLSNKISRINIVCGKDNNTLTNKLVSQTIWHFIDGLSNRIVEIPQKSKFKKFIVDMGNSSSNLIFYKSNITNRWWLEVSNGKKTKITACTFADYQKACNKDIPIRWIREVQKMGKMQNPTVNKSKKPR